jgi:hypothetical protein
MNSDLQKTIQIFLTNCDKILYDAKMFGHSNENYKYSHLFLKKSVDLLRKCVVSEKDKS